MADDLSRLRIAKKAYVFDTRRKFAASRSFAVKKKPETPAEDIKQNVMAALAGLRGKKPPSGEKKPAAKPSGPAQKKAPSFSLMKTALLVLVLFVAGAGLFIMLKLGEAAPQQQLEHPEDFFSGSYDYSVADSRVLTVGAIDRPQRSAYLLVSYQSANLSALNFTASIFADHPSSQVFLLDYARDGADSYPTFRKEFLSGLSSAGLPASEIEIDKVPFMPAGALLVVPTGYLPKELIGRESGFGFKDLMGRGVTIIYIGLPFNDRVLDRDGLTLSSNYSELSFSRSEAAQLRSTDGLQLSNARYGVTVPEAARSQFSQVGRLYGSVSAVKYRGGYMIFLPQSLDGGWGDEGGAQAASDIVRLIKEERWLAPLASVALAGDLSGGSHSLSLFSAPPFSSDSAYAKLTVQAADQKGIGRASTQVLLLQKTQKGEMTPVEPQTVPYYLSGGRTSLNIQLRESSTKLVKLYIRMYNNGVLNQTSEMERGLTDPTTENFPNLEVDAEPGNYTVLVEDESGKVYAATQLSVIGLDIAQNSSDFGRGRFSFLLSAAGSPVQPPDLTVSLDGQNEKQYFRDSLRVSPDGAWTAVDYDYGGEVKPGSHQFIFSFAGRWTKALQMEYSRSPPFWENPIVIFLGILSVIVFGIGILLRRPEKLRYGLDIPDFPPLSSIKIPVKKATVLEILDSVNAAYSWQWMPLRSDEIKNGFRKLTYNGKPILIGDFNLERVLARLRDEGLVKEEIGYWGRTEWERQSRHSIGYLAIYRVMRNVFVNNAVRFSKLDAMANCDVKAIAGKEEIYFHIMEEPFEQKVHRALATSKKGTTIMVFKSDEERDSFRDSLTSTSKLAVALKMEVNSGNILMLPVKNAITAYLKGIMK